MNIFRIYIAGRNHTSDKAVRDFREFLERKLKDRYSLEVLDMLESPPQALEDNIIVTPTVLRVSPPPQKKVIGDIRAIDVIFDILLEEVQ